MNDNGMPPPVIVDVLATDEQASWQPQPGLETQGLMLPAGAEQQIIGEAMRILRRCIDPNGPAQVQTGIAVGYVQSGKTTSFTTVAALARDNGFRLVIFIAGTTEALFFQNRDRLISALRLETRPRNTPWRHVTQPKVNEHAQDTIRDTLAQWNFPAATADERRTVIVTVMKHHKHLQNLVDVLALVNLQGVPTLIIDDEGDQAGLNTEVRQGDESSTYRRLVTLKSSLPLHSYLHYTATPQAPLLINLVDVLSPTFAEVLTPGEGYVGGVDFFINNPRLVRDIPIQQVPTTQTVLKEPPATLTESMLLFYTGVAVGYITGQPERNCSMMVHPSQKTDPQRQFFGWVTSARTQWLEIVDLPPENPDRVELMAMFKAAYDDLATTTANIPSFAEVAANLRRALSRTEVREVNTRKTQKTPKIKWGESYSWILVGGQAMDRGFTVEGLTVTYMPRNLGIGNADTVQQRARFFGYKRNFLGLCRIFVGPDVRDAFVRYVEHEEDIRCELARFSKTGRALIEWRREFFLDRSMRPTRANVLDIVYQRVRFGNEWVYPDGPHDSNEAVVTNHALYNEFRGTHPFGSYSGTDTRSKSYRNLVIENAALQHIHEELLTRFRVSRLEDSQQFGAMLRLIQLHLVKEPGATCTVFLMAEGNRRRRAYKDDKIVQLFQGRQYAKKGAGKKVMTYPGDRDVRSASGISIQMGYLDLEPTSEPVRENIPYLAVWIPSEMARDSLSQPQGG